VLGLIVNTIVAEQPKEAEYHVSVAGGVGDDLARPRAGLRVNRSVEGVWGVGLVPVMTT